MRVLKRVAFAVVTFLVVLALAGCTAAPAGPLRVDATFDGKSVELAPGAELVVALEGNPTTGFDWRVAGSLPAQLTAKGDTLESTAGAGVVGAGGTRVFTFTAAEIGDGTLKMEYLRAWETTVPPVQTFTLDVVVK